MNICPERTKTVVAHLGEGPGLEYYSQVKLREGVEGGGGALA